MGIPDDVIIAYTAEPLSMDIPGNSQFVERLVQTCCKNGLIFSSQEMREGSTKATNNFRKQIPNRISKAGFAGIENL